MIVRLNRSQRSTLVRYLSLQPRETAADLQPDQGKTIGLKRDSGSLPRLALAVIIVSIGLVQSMGCRGDQSTARVEPYVFIEHLAEAG